MDEDRNVYYLGIKDDVIKSDGYSIAPIEVEDALGGHPAVAKAAAFGTPDRVRGEIIKALVVLKRGLTPSPELAEEIAQYARVLLGAYNLPPEIEFVPRLPRTPKGKVHRSALRRPGRQEWA
jgi:acetyl-CoA synthetase